MSNRSELYAWIRGHATAIGAVAAILTLIILLGGLLTSRYYKDADGDGFGDPLQSSVGWRWQLPEGYVKDNNDCYDGNENAYPGQPRFFAVDRGDGSFDYDCNQVSERETVTQGECDGGRAAPQGWDGGAPECGRIGRWLVDCDRRLPLYKIVREHVDKTQKCH